MSKTPPPLHETLTSMSTSASDENPLISYEISVQTGDRMGAGTHGPVFLTMYGDQGISTKIELTDESSTEFERAQLTKFRCKFPSIGQLEQIELIHGSVDQRWYLQEITIDNTATKER
ncbi:unnamed protein product, partial [Rotaria sp. Silwood1]